MNDIQKYPLALQLLMQTDGTVTELIKLLSNEDVNVIKLLENMITENGVKILHRHIYLQGVLTKKNWLYAESKIFLDNLPQNFVNDLLHKTVPIGTLWNNYRIETFKQVTKKQQETSKGIKESGFRQGVALLSRTYQVFNKQNPIMQITEKFPIVMYQGLI